jgi:radical SAM superfamily enzyme YgiQ (UPF0313 family)
MKKNFKIISGTIGSRLGDNELRTYLSNKRETGNGGNLLDPSYHNFSIGFSENIRVSLVSPAITIPKGMAKRCIPPLGLSYIAAYLEKKSIDVQMFDCAVEGYNHEVYSEGDLMTYGMPVEKAAKTILKQNPDIIGMSVLFSTDLDNLFKLSLAIKSISPKVIIVVGGLHPTIYPMDIFNICKDNNKSCIDFIIRGEGEKRLYELISDLKMKRVNTNMDGLCGYINNNIFINNQFDTIADLDSIPFPAYHLLPMDKYFSINVPFSPVPKGKRVIQILTTRGCPIGCSFCSSTNMYKKYRMRSVNNVIDEILFFKEKYAIDEVQFADDNIFFNKKRTINLFTEIIKAKVFWCTPNGVMINTINEKLIGLLKDSGLYQITLSIDSGSANTLKNLQHKPVRLNTIPGIVKRCNELGIFSHGTLVVGMPNETMKDIKEGFDFVKDLELTSISVFIAAAIPGSELYHEALDNNLITKESANRINTTTSNIHLSDISKNTLEDIVMNFQRKFTDNVKKKNPDMWKKKYASLIEKSKSFDDDFGGRLT